MDFVVLPEVMQRLMKQGEIYAHEHGPTVLLAISSTAFVVLCCAWPEEIGKVPRARIWKTWEFHRIA